VPECCRESPAHVTYAVTTDMPLCSPQRYPGRGRVQYDVVMADELKELLERAQAWPKQAQGELVSAGLEIEEKYVRSGPHSADEERAWVRLERLFARMRSLNPQVQRRTPEEIRKEEEEIAEEIRMMRRRRHA
jgi:hypothetical protein